MSLSIGIVGLPNVGKSSLFKLLTKKQVEASNYPFCTIDPNVGVVKVPDERLAQIANISKPEKIIQTTIEFVDIAGLVKGAHQGEGLGNQFLANIRQCDAICQVIRIFEDKNVIHVSGKIDPKQDKAIIDLELILADLATVSKKLEKTKREAKSNDKEIVKELHVLEKIYAILSQEKALRYENFNEDELVFIKSLHLLSIKPIIYLLNSDDNNKKADISENYLEINVKLEEEILLLEENEQAEYLKELGITESGLDKLIRKSYDILNLSTFFTTGPKETRAWTIKKGSKAPQAAGVIHTDFIKNFIRAEVVNWQDFVKAQGESKAKESGLIRTEGKDYIVQDGDICHFLINK
jgi:ribosome-binding ATPase